MAYDQQQDALRAYFLSVVGASFGYLDMQGLWDRYLVSIGLTTGTVLDRQAAQAKVLGIPLPVYASGRTLTSMTLGPDIAAGFITDGLWTTVLPGATDDGTGLHFVDCDAGTQAHTIDTEDNVTYRITWTIANLTEGSFRWQLYGDTTAHLGQTSTVSANGDYSEDVSTTAAGSLNNLIRANVTGPAAGNTMDITALSVRKVL